MSKDPLLVDTILRDTRRCPIVGSSLIDYAAHTTLARERKGLAMRCHLPILVVLTMLLSAVRPSALIAHARVSAPPGPPKAACGAEAPDGLILYRAYDDSGAPADPPLALMDPTNTIYRPVAVPDPQVITPIPFGCRAVVRSGSGSTYLVDGATGEARELSLGDLPDEVAPWEYQSRSGGQRWGLFTPSRLPLEGYEQAMVVDFATGQVTDLFDLIPGMVAMTTPWFSPSGAYLVINAEEPRDGVPPSRQWLVPMEHPDQARPLGSRFALVQAFDETDRRMLYWQVGRGRQDLVIEDLSNGTIRAVAAAPGKEGDKPFLQGWFLPGTDDLAVQHPDRFVILDLSRETPKERFVVDGAFDRFQAAPSGTGGILTGYLPPGSKAARPLTYVDFDRQITRPITSQSGEPIRFVGIQRVALDPARWVLLTVGASADAPTALASFDLATGELTPLISLEDELLDLQSIQHVDDGRVALVLSIGTGGSRRLLMLDAEHGTADVLVEANSVSGALSADGTWAAYSTVERTDGGLTKILSVIDVASGTTAEIGPGLEPTWLAP